jgi:hypothetical protein
MKISLEQKNRNQAVKAILKGQRVWINTWSTDCDGCSSQGSKEIKTVSEIVEFEKGFEKSLEWADGPMGYSFIFDPSEILESYCGGSWGNY